MPKDIVNPSDPEEREWRREVQFGMVKHLNRLCLILDNKIVYEIDPEDYTGLDNIILQSIHGESFVKAWIPLDWVIESLVDYLGKVSKNKYWTRHKYTAIIREAAMWVSRMKKEIVERTKNDVDGE